MCTANKACRVISVSNQKGGVGKTVTCVNLGIGLAREGKRVLLIDADPQGSLTISLGFHEPDQLEYSLATVMMKIINDECFNVQNGIIHHEEIDILLEILNYLDLRILLVLCRKQYLKNMWSRQERNMTILLLIVCLHLNVDY